MKYTGVESWLRERGKKPIDLGELTEVARANELKMKVRELAFNEEYQKAELLDRMKEAKQKLMHRFVRSGEDMSEASYSGWSKLSDKEAQLKLQQPQ